MSNNKPLVKISGKIQDIEKKVKNIKPKQSNVLLTLNTNQQFKEDDKHLKDTNLKAYTKLNKYLSDITGKPSDFKKIGTLRSKLLVQFK